jgi:hypothetical protein
MAIMNDQQHTSLLEYTIKDDIMSSQVHENTLEQHQVYYNKGKK